MVTRRNFLKLGAIAATASVSSGAALTAVKGPLQEGGKDFSVATGKQRAAVFSACWQCVTRCPNIGYVEDGRLVKIEGQPNSIRSEGVMCAKGQAGVNQIYDPDRILYPMKRVGARGEGKWKRISWDEALSELAGHLMKLRAEGQPGKLMFHYGRMKASSSKIIKIFLGTFGTGTIGNHTSICEGGKWTAQELTWGGHYDNWDFDNTNFVLNFGSNVLENHTNHIPTSQRLVRAMAERSVRMVTFDVRLSNTAAKSTEWVPIKPGTDLAVVLAMCNVVMNEDLYKGPGEAFLKFCKATKNPDASVEEKVAALRSHLAQYTPQWAEGISGVPAEKIRAIAREFATTRPACLISYRGAIAHHNGNETERACQMLASITGNIDNPGGRCKAVGAHWKYPTGPKDKPKAKKLKILDGFEGQAAFPTHHMSHHVLKMIKDGRRGRPEIYMWYCYNPVYANGEVQENIDVLKDEKLIPYTVCIDPFYDESAAYADLILPDATYLERWDWEDMVSPVQVPEYYIRQPIVPPLGEVRDFGDVCCDLAKRMGFPLGFESKEDFVRQSCELTETIQKAGGFEYMKQNGVYHDPEERARFFSYLKEIPAEALAADGVIFDEASQVYWNWTKSGAKSEEDALAKGYVHTKKSYKGYVGQRIGDKVYRGFPPDKVNKTGYLEIYSELMEEKGFNPLPTYYPIPEHQEMAEDELILTTYKVNVQTHSRTQNCKWLSEIYHENTAWLNPETAVARGIADGDMVKVSSEVGEITIKARVTPAEPPGVVSISFHCGHWRYGRYASANPTPEGLRPDIQDPDAHRVWWRTNNGAHPNWVIPNKADPISGQHCWNDTVVRVEKIASA